MKIPFKIKYIFLIIIILSITLLAMVTKIYAEDALDGGGFEGGGFEGGGFEGGGFEGGGFEGGGAEGGGGEAAPDSGMIDPDTFDAWANEVINESERNIIDHAGAAADNLANAALLARSDIYIEGPGYRGYAHYDPYTNSSVAIIEITLPDGRTIVTTSSAQGPSGSAPTDIGRDGDGFDFNWPPPPPPPPTPPPPPPIADIKANGSDGPITIPYNTKANISWTSSNANSCAISPTPPNTGGSTSGSGQTASLTQSTTYTLTCTGSGGSASDRVTINVTLPPSCSQTSSSHLPQPTNFITQLRNFITNFQILTNYSIDNSSSFSGKFWLTITGPENLQSPQKNFSSGSTNADYAWTPRKAGDYTLTVYYSWDIENNENQYVCSTKTITVYRYLCYQGFCFECPKEPTLSGGLINVQSGNCKTVEPAKCQAYINSDCKVKGRE